MGQYWDAAQQAWVHQAPEANPIPTDQAHVTSDWADPNQAVEQAKAVVASTNPPQTTVNPVEDTSMLKGWLGQLADKVIENSSLKDTIKAMQDRITELELGLDRLGNELAVERNNHNLTRTELADVRSRLEHEQRAVHDLVMERDIVVEERNKAQQERNEWRKEAETNAQAHVAALSERDQHKEAAAVAHERANRMADQVRALQGAFKALQVIE